MGDAILTQEVVLQYATSIYHNYYKYEKAGVTFQKRRIWVLVSAVKSGLIEFPQWHTMQMFTYSDNIFN